VVTILLVEDNVLLQEILHERLTALGYEVLLAGDGNVALSIVHNDLPDLILMDLSLPHLDGLEATKQLKANMITRHIPIIMLTAYGLAGDRERIMAAGCDDFETKPINFPDLVTKIQLYTQVQE